MVSVDYLIRPLEIFKEVNRVLRPGGKFILSQSNRCFPTKAIAMWLGMSDLQHCLVIGEILGDTWRYREIQGDVGRWARLSSSEALTAL